MNIVDRIYNNDLIYFKQQSFTAKSVKTSGFKSRIDNQNDTVIKEINYCHKKEPTPPTDTETEAPDAPVDPNGPDAPIDPNNPGKDPEDYEGDFTI